MSPRGRIFRKILQGLVWFRCGAPHAAAPVKIYRVEFDLYAARHLRARPLVWFAFIRSAYFLAPGWPFRVRSAALFLAWIAPLFGARQIFALLFGAWRSGARRALAKGFARRRLRLFLLVVSRQLCLGRFVPLSLCRLWARNFPRFVPH